MNKHFIPNLYVSSIGELYAAFFQKNHLRGVVLDIDNTLVPHNYPVPDERAKQFIQELLEAGIKVCFASNNRKERVVSFNQFDLPFVSRAMKPFRFGYWRCMHSMKTRPEETAVIGDQIFSDIWGGNRAGAFTILVDPIQKSEKEGRFIAWKRHKEEKILQTLRKEMPDEYKRNH